MKTLIQKVLETIFKLLIITIVVLLVLIVVNNCHGQTTQTIHLQKGWNLISSNVIPDTSDIEYIFRNADVAIVISLGGVYWPDHNVNDIVSWKHNEGYKVKVNTACDITLTGTPSDISSVNLNAGLNWLIMPLDYRINAADLFEPVNDKIILVVDVATTALYWPEFGINTLGNIVPGKAYYAYVFSPATVNFK